MQRNILNIEVRRKSFCRKFGTLWESKEQQRKFFDDLAKKLNIRNPEEWYQITKSDALQHGAANILPLYANSLPKALAAIYPEINWDEIKFSIRKPNEFWKDGANQKKFFDDLANELHLKSWEDWYNVGARDIIARGGSRVLKHIFGGSPMKAIMTIYPEHKWLPWKFKHIPAGFFQEKENQQNFFEYLAQQLNIKKPEDWYEISSSNILELGGASFLKVFDYSVPKALKAVYPKMKWSICRFKRIPHEFWNDRANHKEFFNQLFEELALTKWEDWYKIRKSDIENFNGSTLLYHFYQGSPWNAIMAAYPELPWKISEFIEVKEHRVIFDEIEKKLKIEDKSDWYKFSQGEINDQLTSTVLNYYGGSSFKALPQVYSEYPWKLWKFKQVPKGFWFEEKNVRDALKYLSDQLSIKQLDDWYTVSTQSIIDLGLGGLMHSYGGIQSLLEKFYPDHNWAWLRETHIYPSKVQQHLHATLQGLFPKFNVHNQYIHPTIKFESGQPISLDVFIPEQSLAFEYQGQQHYVDNKLYGKQEELSKRDQEKRKLCENAGITLIPIPYWWDLSKGSLAATIHKYKPSLINENDIKEFFPIQVGLPPNRKFT